jgi:hypothetical protein
LLITEGTSCIGERGEHIIAIELVFLHDLFHGHAAPELPNDEVNGHARARDDRFSTPDPLVNGDSRSDLSHSR